jgi:hypothetical protein
MAAGSRRSTISSETGAIDDDAALAFPFPAFWAQDMNLAPRFKPEIKMYSHYKGNSHGDGSKAILSSIIIIIITYYYHTGGFFTSINQL